MAIRVDVGTGSTSSVPISFRVVAVTEHQPKALVRAEALAEGRVIAKPRLAGVDRVIATQAFKIERGPAAGGLPHVQVH